MQLTTVLINNRHFYSVLPVKEEEEQQQPNGEINSRLYSCYFDLTFILLRIDFANWFEADVIFQFVASRSVLSGR